MPAIVDKFTIEKDFGKSNDKRIKLTDEQRDLIVVLHKQGESQRSLATQFNVSRRLIGFIVNPDSLKEFKEKRKGSHKKYYDTERHKNYMRSHREHKKELLTETGENNAL